MAVTPVFYDPSMKRKRWARMTLVAGLAIATCVFVLFCATLVIAPQLPAAFAARVVTSRVGALVSHHFRRNEHRLRMRRDRTLRAIGPTTSHSAPPQHIVAGFYAPWQESGIHSFRANASQVTHLFPAWLRLAPNGSVDFRDWNPKVVYHNLEVVSIARAHGVRLLPVLSNADGGAFDAARVHLLLSDARVRQQTTQQIVSWLAATGMNGVNVDFENLSDEDRALLPEFLNGLHQQLAARRLQLAVDLEADTAGPVWRDIARVADIVVVMSYDEHSSADGAGAIASIDWYRRVLRSAVQLIPAEKLVIGLGSYAYDWTENESGAEPMSYEQALIRARDRFGSADAPGSIDFDPALLNPTYDYVDDEHHEHEVWLLDAVTAANQWLLAQREGVSNVAVWAFGLEDPSVWRLFTPEREDTVDRLTAIHFPYAIEFVGEGEILHMSAQPRDGVRQIERDPLTGLLIDESYRSFPTPYVIERSGLMPKSVALTIDDGPVAPYTGQMLDALRRNGVKATFFLIGSNVEREPALARRIVDEGHEVGNHSFTHGNMGQMSEFRATLELNATQRAIESATGRSTVLFRPPYNADAEPTTLEEVLPVVRASELGYVAVGEFIDPQDWRTTRVDASGRSVKRSAGEIAADTLAAVHANHGNCILLHDGGGDRRASVAALDLIIPALKREGYRFVTVSQLMGSSSEAVMPRTAISDKILLGDDRMVFGATSLAGRLLSIAFITAIALALLRSVGLTLLAVRARRRAEPAPVRHRGSVSVLIAAYNEERVIEKTITSVLANSRPPDEVIVIDDGSLDATSSIVEAMAERDPRVRLVRQENAGKAQALNRGIALASGDVFVCIDADTVLHGESIGRLVDAFSDPKIGAVAGNVRVGNARRTVATAIQSIEYTTSQNLDRRAWSDLNAITVVPGAIGAWRREAVDAAGRYSNDTLAEDMDLTWRVRMEGWHVGVVNDAFAFTEAPERFGPLFKQRFRWAYGTLQCLWKHRRALGRHGWFGAAMLPSLWSFQIGFQLLSPLVDLQLLLLAVDLLSQLFTNASGAALQRYAFVSEMLVFFVVVDMLMAAIALRMEGEPLRQLLLIPLQRFFYRQLMYAAIFKSLLTAVQGLRTGWGKLERTASVGLPPTEQPAHD